LLCLEKRQFQQPPGAYRKVIKKIELGSSQSMVGGGKTSGSEHKLKQGWFRPFIRKASSLLGQSSIGTGFPEVFCHLHPRGFQDKSR